MLIVSSSMGMDRFFALNCLLMTVCCLVHVRCLPSRFNNPGSMEERAAPVVDGEELMTPEEYRRIFEKLQHESELIKSVQDESEDIVEDGDEHFTPEQFKEFFGTQEKNGKREAEIANEVKVEPEGISEMNAKMEPEIILETKKESTDAVEDVDKPLTTEQYREMFGSEGNDTKRGVVLDGDMVVTKEQLDSRFGQDQGGMEKRDGLANSGYYWSDGVVPYKIDETKPLKSMKYDIEAGFIEWEMKTCIKFDKYDKGKHVYFVHFRSGCGGCWAHIGQAYMDRRNGQTLCLDDTACRSTVEHELGHTIGLGHEQSRPDRDKYVTILTKNLKDQKQKHNFFRMDNSNTRGLPYDYTSLMHYGSSYFAKSGTKTIITKDPKYQSVIGQRKRISPLDAKVVNLMYCPDQIECTRMNKGQDYRGQKNRDVKGRSCTNWSKQKYNNPKSYPHAGLEKNFCRNPDGEPSNWCYVNTAKRWENCDIPRCDESKSRFIAAECSKSNQKRSLKLECNGGRKIKIVRAFYGAWEGDEEKCFYSPGDCIDPTDHANRCNNRAQCTVAVEKSSRIYHCSGIIGKIHDFLQIHYDCV